jgi:hypothetical protein
MLICRQNPRLAQALTALIKDYCAGDLSHSEDYEGDIMVSQDRFAVYRATVSDVGEEDVDGSQFSTGTQSHTQCCWTERSLVSQPPCGDVSVQVTGTFTWT